MFRNDYNERNQYEDQNDRDFRREYSPERRRDSRQERQFFRDDTSDRGEWRRDRYQGNSQRDQRDRRSPERRSRSPRREREREPVSNKILLTSVPPHIDRDSMNIILSQQGFSPIDVRVIQKSNDNGGLRQFGFLEFSTTDEAKKYLRFNNVSYY